MYHKHICPDCTAGLVWTMHAEPSPKAAWTADDERAAVVAWLRSDAFIIEFSKKENLGRIMCDVAAETIERGEHRKEKA